MSWLTRCLFALSCLGLPTCLSADEGPPRKEEKTARLDAHGDPLPEQALLRLGTVRFRVGERIEGAALTPDGKTVAVVGHKRAWLLDAATGKELRHSDTLEFTNTFTYPPAFSSDGRVLIAAGHPGDGCAWDVDTARLLDRMKGSELGNSPRGFAVSGDRKVAVFGVTTGKENVVRAWEIASGNEVGRFTATWPGSIIIALSPDGKTLA